MADVNWTAYVNGFMIKRQANGDHKVLFIKKNRPEFQKGKWNGIGGKIEHGETPHEAMVREFREETGVETDQLDWTYTLALQGPYFVVHFFRSFVDVFPPYRSVTDEVVQDWPIASVYQPGKFGIPTLDNMKWILPLQLNTNILFPLHVDWLDAR